MIFRLFFSLILLTAFQKVSAQAKDIFISTTGSDKNRGSFDDPLLTVEKAKETVRSYKKNNPNQKGKVSVYFLKGVYELDAPLKFGTEDLGTNSLTIEYNAFPGHEVIISGGKSIKGRWEIDSRSDDITIWKIHIEGAENGKFIFRQLFADGRRLPRASSINLTTEGPLSMYSNSIKRYGFEESGALKQSSLDAFCSFKYRTGDLDHIKTINGAEILMYHSWECSWHSIARIDTLTRTVYLKSSSRYPVGFFSNHVRYRIENTREVLDDFDEWYLDIEKGDLYYAGYKNEDPNAKEFIVPITNKLLTIKGDTTNSSKFGYVSFIGLQFNYSGYPLGINDLADKIKVKGSNQFPWLDFSTGFSSSQAAVDAGEAIIISHASHISFSNCTFAHLGNYAIGIKEYGHHNTIDNCTIYDVGGGGVLIGYNVGNPIERALPFSSSPAFNKVHNSFIYNIGKVHPSSVGIGIMQANNTTITNNEIYNAPYTGISCGWTWDSIRNYTKHNLIANNHIHHVMQELDDGGGIYTLGQQPGAILKGNYIHDIYRSRGAIGSFNNGIFFDEHSALIKVEENVIHSIENEPIRFNQTSKDKMLWGVNYFNVPLPFDKPSREVINKAGHLYHPISTSTNKK